MPERTTYSKANPAAERTWSPGSSRGCCPARAAPPPPGRAEPGWAGGQRRTMPGQPGLPQRRGEAGDSRLRSPEGSWVRGSRAGSGGTAGQEGKPRGPAKGPAAGRDGSSGAAVTAAAHSAQRPSPAAAPRAGPAASLGGASLNGGSGTPEPRAHLPAAAAPTTAVRGSSAPPYLSRARRERRVRVPRPPPPPPPPPAPPSAPPGGRWGSAFSASASRPAPFPCPCPCPCPLELTQSRGEGANAGDAQGAEVSAGATAT